MTIKLFFKKYQKAIIKRLLLLLAVVLMIIYSNLLKVVDYRFNDVGYQGDRGLNIALITDLHSCYYGDNQKWLIDILKKRQPDVILLGGDIYDDKLPFNHADELLSQLADIAPSYYVDGNHENWLDKKEYDDVMSRIRQHRITIIHGQEVPIANNVYLYGVSDPDGGQFEKDLQSITPKLKPENVNILLTHRPERIDEYQQYAFDVILAGHAHGGQWRVPFLINGVYAPNQGLFPKYAGGLYKLNDNQVKFIVSRGLARESTRVPRLFNRPELVFVELGVSGLSKR